MLGQDTTDLRMVVFLAALALGSHIVTGPPACELGADRAQAADELLEIGIAYMATVVTAKPGDDILCASRPIHEQGAQCGVGEGQPYEVALRTRHCLEIEEEGARRKVPRKHVPSGAHDEGRDRGHPIERPLDQGADFVALGTGLNDRSAQGELKQLDPLNGVKLKHLCEAIQHGGRDFDRALLFEPCVPGGAHAGELCHFFAA